MKPEKCPKCLSANMLVGLAKTQGGGKVHPHYCGDCGVVLATMQANKAEVAAFIAAHGELQRVYTSTEVKLNHGLEVSVPRALGRSCEVCGDDEGVEVHHWAPAHLFGAECDKWPVGYLCRRCHMRWHQLVTPGMGKRGDKEKNHRGPHHAA